MSKAKPPTDFAVPLLNESHGFDDEEWGDGAGALDHGPPLNDADDDWGSPCSSDENNSGLPAEDRRVPADPSALHLSRPPLFSPNDKQVPSGNRRPAPPDNPKQKPDFSALKNNKLPPPKDKDPINHINLNGNSKPHLGITGRKPAPASAFSHKEQDLLSSDLRLSSLSKKPQEINAFSSRPDMLDSRPRYEKALEKAEKYIHDQAKRSLEAMFDHNAEGTALLKEINEILTYTIDKHKAQLVADPPPTHKSRSAKLLKHKPARDELSTDRHKSQFQKELEAGDKLMGNLAHEFRELSLQEEKIKTPA